MKVALYGVAQLEGAAHCIIELLEELEKNRIEVVIEKEYFQTLCSKFPTIKEYQTFLSYEELHFSYDFFFSIGGDGTMLRAVTYVRDLGIPIIGINTGRLGFLATVQQETIRQALAELLNKEYEITRRSVLEATVSPETEEAEIKSVNFALNEIAVSRKNTTSMITIATYLNDEYLTSYWADGLMVATPTGSTGYSLSCGGPVISPEAGCLVITPIAPHNLNARPLVIDDSTHIKLKVSGREDAYLLSLDSRVTTISNKAEVTIQKAPFHINMVSLKSESFLKTLRKKLLWGEDKRN